MPKRIFVHIAIIGLIFLAFVCVDLVWLGQNERPPMWDSALHLYNALTCRDYLCSGHFAFKDFLALSPYYPPLFYWLLAPVLVLRATPGAALLVHLPFVLLLIASVYYIGYRWKNNIALASLAALLTVCAPHIQWLSRDIMIDLEAVAVMTGIVALAFWTEGFSHRGRVILLGLAGGLGIALKWTVAFTVTAPMLWLFVWAWRGARPGAERHRLANNVLLGVVLGALVAWPWYLRNFPFLVNHFIPYTQGLGPVEGDPGLWTMAGWVFYLRALLGWQLFGPFFVLALIAVAWAILRRVKGSGVFLVWAAGVYIIFSLFSNKAPRHLTPAIPALALLMAGAVMAVRSPRLRYLLYGLCVLIGLFQAYLVSFGVSGLPKYVLLSQLPNPSFAERYISCRDGRPFSEWVRYWPDGWFLYNQEAFGIWGPPRRETWQIDAVLTQVHTIANTQGWSPTLGLVPDTARLNVWSFKAAALTMHKPIPIWRVNSLDTAGHCFDPYRFILVKDGNQGPLWNTADNAHLTTYLFAHPERFILTGEWPLPDDSVARLFLNNNSRGEVEDRIK